MNYRISGLDPAPFTPLYGLPDAALAAQGVQRCAVTTFPGFPDRIELRDMEVGETALLLNHEHLPVNSPYRACHAIYVREGATHRAVVDNAIPEVIARRLISVRAFGAADMMIDADVVEGAALEPMMLRMLADPGVAYLHLHNAKRGCFAARVDRVPA